MSGGDSAQTMESDNCALKVNNFFCVINVRDRAVGIYCSSMHHPCGLCFYFRLQHWREFSRSA